MFLFGGDVDKKAQKILRNKKGEEGKEKKKMMTKRERERKKIKLEI